MFILAITNVDSGVQYSREFATFAEAISVAQNTAKSQRRVVRVLKSENLTEGDSDE